jgi:hypothetical protein
MSSFTCRTLETAKQEGTGLTVEYLDRQDVQCGANEVLGGFKLKNDARAKRVWYEYKCCKAPEPVGGSGVASSAARV